MSKLNWDSITEVSLYIHYWAERTFANRNPDASLFKLVLYEIPELLTHKRNRGANGIEGELADCFVLLMDLSVIWNVNLKNAIRDKMQLNERRSWRQDDAGLYQHVNLAASTTILPPVESEGGEI